MNGRLLIVDDEESIRYILRRHYQGLGLEVLTAGSGVVASRICSSALVDVVLLDLRLPDMDGLDILGQIKTISPPTGVIMITAYGDVDTAVRAMQLGASTFLLKPVDLNALDAIVLKVLGESRTRSEVLYLQERVSQLSGYRGPSRLRLPANDARSIEKLARSGSATVLLLGETGTGKGVVARLIHDLSPRSSGQLIDVNCASLTPEFLESELFGHEQGAFTDAKQFKRGLLELADGGTMFLDEVAELSLSAQAKLLKVVEEKTFRRLGGTANITVDARLIAATNRDLDRSARGGTFRKDLLYRLNVMQIRLAPLRERNEDIMPLAQDFLEELAGLHAQRPRAFSPGARSALQEYLWPGNIRELRNVVERAVLLCEAELIGLEHLPPNILRKPGRQIAPEGDLSLAAAERRHIASVLEMSNGNKSQAARLLGIHRSTLIQKTSRRGPEDSED